MILVLAGTADGRELAGQLAAAGIRVIASAATAYGGELLEAMPGVEVRNGLLDAEGMAALVRERGVRGILDATHPFAIGISQLAWQVAVGCGVNYLRWERPRVQLPEHQLLHRVPDWETAVEQLANLQVRRIFLAVGVKVLPLILQHPRLAGCEFTVKVLPVLASLQSCRQLGLKPSQIVAFQGAGAKALIESLLQFYGAEVLVTKESGGEGGTAEKVAAAIQLGIPVLLVDRPLVASDAEITCDRETVLHWAEEVEIS